MERYRGSLRSLTAGGSKRGMSLNGVCTGIGENTRKVIGYAKIFKRC